MASPRVRRIIQGRASPAHSRPRAHQGFRHHRASAPLRVPFRGTHLRAGHRRQHRHDAGRPPAPSTTKPKKDLKGGGNVAAAKVIGKAIAERAKAAGVEKVVFDRGGYKYHGRVKALADAAREAGLQF